MVTTNSKISERQIDLENLLITKSDIKSLTYNDLTETNIQGIIVSGLRRRLYDYKNFVEEVEIKNLPCKKGKDDTWLNIHLVQGSTINIGIEAKRSDSYYSYIKDDMELMNAGLVQEIEYINSSPLKKGGNEIHVIMVICERFVSYLYVSKNQAAFYELIECIDTNNSKTRYSPCKLWDRFRDTLKPICEKFKWEDKIIIDSNFTYGSIIDPILKNLEGNTWKLM